MRRKMHMFRVQEYEGGPPKDIRKSDAQRVDLPKDVRSAEKEDKASLIFCVLPSHLTFINKIPFFSKFINSSILHVNQQGKH